MKKKNTTERYSSEKLARTKSRSDWDKARYMSEKKLERAIASDPDETGIEWDWDHPIVMPAPKEQVTLRLDQDILRWFKRQGRGYQTRMNAVLRSYIANQPPC